MNHGDPGIDRTVVAILGPTASGKSALGLALAKRFGGEIISCDSTAVYKGFDIGTDKVPIVQQDGVPHYLVDLVEPSCEYTAADYARDAMRAILDIRKRGRLPILVGGTGFYYRALVRGLFPGPARDPAIRGRLERIAAQRGVERLHRWLARVDPPSAVRIQSRDLVRIVRALEVYLKSGTPLTQHFADTRAPLDGWTVIGLVVAPPWTEITDRIARRVDVQFARGIVDEVRQALAIGVPATSRPFTGYVYRRVLEHVRGERDEAATRELIVRENRHYARRQLIWFRKEPNLVWIHRAGERDDAIDEAGRMIGARLGLMSVTGPLAETATDGPDV
ncbi:MAG: tRNA (adenosine(37)-N6)-dimethylallyltransferase MiaA [Acidobacteria bacterium]|nr:tRNA (adenosine(37)-N6)-dimethylallyltransferase MiaA [Acidobacteriota bacterium]